MDKIGVLLERIKPGTKLPSVFLTLAIFASTAGYGNTEVKFQTNRIHCLFNFVEALEGNPHRAEQFVKKFNESSFNTDENRQFISEMKPIFETIWNTGYHFSGYPDSRYPGRTIQDLFIRQSANSKSLEDFRERTQELLPSQHQKKLFEILKRFEPIYYALIWKPAFEKSQSQIGKLKVMAKKINLGQLFEQASHFYNSSWPSDQSFVVSLNPIPGISGPTSSEADGDLLTLGFLIDGHDIEGNMGVVVHEMAHTLYHSQSVEFQNSLDGFFKRSHSKYAMDAYELLNEGLATAVGNAWAQSQFDPKAIDHRWYNDSRVEAFARGLYPIVKEYIEKDEVIDATFIEKSIAVYGERVAILPKP